MKKVFCLAAAICIIMTTFIGCEGVKQEKKGDLNNDDVVQSQNFSEDMAISNAIKDHPEFPDKVGIKELKVHIGGPYDYKCPVKLETKVEKESSDSYQVILTKTYGIKIGNKVPVSYWKYSVSQDKVLLLESVDNDNISIN